MAKPGDWRARLYVTPLLWRQLRREKPWAQQGAILPGPGWREACPRQQDHQKSAASRRLPDGPWDDSSRQRRPVRSCVIMAGVLVLAWLLADSAAEVLANIDFDTFLSRR